MYRLKESLCVSFYFFIDTLAFIDVILVLNLWLIKYVITLRLYLTKASSYGPSMLIGIWDI